MGVFALTFAIGFVSGVFSGMFGIGGGILTTPALRLLLGVDALIAVGTPLLVIIPSALTGALTYARKESADIRAGAMLGLSGAPFAVAGALLAKRVGGSVVLVLTALLIVYVAIDMTSQIVRGTHAAESSEPQPAPRPSTGRLAIVGMVTGLYSGLLGLGGGFVLVPLLTRWFRFPVKRAIGTSLVAVACLAVPGSVTHYLLGNVDLVAAGLLATGVIPGAFVGARITLGTSDRVVRVGFATLLASVGVLLAVTELGRF